MKKNVIISLKGSQQGEGNEKEEIELVTEGSYYLRYSIILHYNETEVTGLEGQPQPLNRRHKVTMPKLGKITLVIFEKGQRFMLL